MGGKIHAIETPTECTRVQMVLPERFKEGYICYSQVVNNVINWLKYSANPETVSHFKRLCADHNTERKTMVRLYYEAKEFTRETAIEYDIPMMTVIHCALETAEAAGYFDQNSEGFYD